MDLKLLLIDFVNGKTPQAVARDQILKFLGLDVGQAEISALLSQLKEGKVITLLEAEDMIRSEMPRLLKQLSQQGKERGGKGDEKSFAA